MENRYYKGQESLFEDPYVKKKRLEKEQALSGSTSEEIAPVIPNGSTDIMENQYAMPGLSKEQLSSSVNNAQVNITDPSQLEGAKPPMDIGKNAMDNIGGIASFGTDIFNAANTTAGSDKEADMRALQLAGKGASLGMSIAGPWGAAAGAVVGGGAGLLMKVPDRKKRLKEDYAAYEGKLFDETNMRKGLAEDYNSQREIEKLMDLKKAQMGLVNLNY